MNDNLKNELKKLIQETNTYYDLNYDDVVSWIIDNREILIKFLLEK